MCHVIKIPYRNTANSITGTTDALVFDTDVDFRVGDVIILTNDPDADIANFTSAQVRIRIDGTPSSPPTPIFGPYSWSLLAIDGDLSTSAQNWSVRLEQSKALFEFN